MLPPPRERQPPAETSAAQQCRLGITYLSSYFVRDDYQRVESLHFHELVHVVQWQHLGANQFIMAYALGHLLSGGYRTNPLEEQAYGLEARFNQNAQAFDVAALVRPELDRILSDLLNWPSLSGL